MQHLLHVIAFQTKLANLFHSRFLLLQTHAKLLVLLGEFFNSLRDVVEIDVIFRSFNDDRRFTTTKSARRGRSSSLLLLLLRARLCPCFVG